MKDPPAQAVERVTRSHMLQRCVRCPRFALSSAAWCAASSSCSPAVVLTSSHTAAHASSSGAAPRRAAARSVAAPAARSSSRMPGCARSIASTSARGNSARSLASPAAAASPGRGGSSSAGARVTKSSTSKAGNGSALRSAASRDASSARDSSSTSGSRHASSAASPPGSSSLSSCSRRDSAAHEEAARCHRQCAELLRGKQAPQARSAPCVSPKRPPAAPRCTSARRWPSRSTLRRFQKLCSSTASVAAAPASTATACERTRLRGAHPPHATSSERHRGRCPRRAVQRTLQSGRRLAALSPRLLPQQRRCGAGMRVGAPRAAAAHCGGVRRRRHALRRNATPNRRRRPAAT